MYKVLLKAKSIKQTWKILSFWSQIVLMEDHQVGSSLTRFLIQNLTHKKFTLLWNGKSHFNFDDKTEFWEGPSGPSDFVTWSLAIVRKFKLFSENLRTLALLIIKTKLFWLAANSHSILLFFCIFPGKVSGWLEEFQKSGLLGIDNFEGDNQSWEKPIPTFEPRT